jgi:hypothetical protein
MRDDHLNQNDHVHGRNHSDDAGKPGALKGARRVWRGAFKKGPHTQYLVGCLPYLPDLVKPFARMTIRYAEQITSIGLATCGKGGARLAARLGIRTSRQTILRRIMELPEFPAASILFLGIDDFAFLRGRRYGTILVNLETRRVADLLPDRKAETAATWMRQQPDLMAVSRDRAGD